MAKWRTHYVVFTLAFFRPSGYNEIYCMDGGTTVGGRNSTEAIRVPLWQVEAIRLHGRIWRAVFARAGRGTDGGYNWRRGAWAFGLGHTPARIEQGQQNRSVVMRSDPREEVSLTETLVYLDTMAVQVRDGACRARMMRLRRPRPGSVDCA